MKTLKWNIKAYCYLPVEPRDELHDQIHQKPAQHKAYRRRLIKPRNATVAPVPNNLINHYNMCCINARGIQAANKHVLMAALSYKLKKHLKFTRKN